MAQDSGINTLKHPWEICHLMSVQGTTLVYAGSLLSTTVYLDRLDSFQRVMPKGGSLLKNGNRMMETRHTSSWLREEHPGPWRRSSTSTIWRLYLFRPSIIILRNSRVNRCPWRYRRHGCPGSTRYLARQRAWISPNTWTQKLLGASISTGGPSPNSNLNQVWHASADPAIIFRTTEQARCHRKDQLILFVFHLDSRSVFMSS